MPIYLGVANGPARTIGLALVRLSLAAQRWLCGLHGHDALLSYERGRIFLRCTSCGHETPGWEIRASAGSRASRPARLAGSRETRSFGASPAVARKVCS